MSKIPLPPVLNKFNDVLKGWPDELITGAMIGLGILLIFVALAANPTVKAVVLTWVILP